jgi:hypothetical protein
MQYWRDAAARMWREITSAASCIKFVAEATPQRCATITLARCHQWAGISYNNANIACLGVRILNNLVHQAESSRAMQRSKGGRSEAQTELLN